MLRNLYIKAKLLSVKTIKTAFSHSETQHKPGKKISVVPKPDLNRTKKIFNPNLTLNKKDF